MTVRAFVLASRRAFLLAAGAALAGCAAVAERRPAVTLSGAEAGLASLDNARFWADAPFDVWRGRLPRDRDGEPLAILAISGGAQDGAYGAGVLTGWSARGDRPRFDIVTGVSTGAFIAPFAFLGSRYDWALEEFYTQYGVDDIIRSQGLRGVLSDALCDTSPLQSLIARYVDEAVLAEIAQAYRDGRRLFVVTTDLDADRPVVWDMGRIASSPTPARLQLFRDVLLASASPPGVFPAVRLEGADNGARVEELHFDGGATMQVLTVPEALLISPEGRPENAPRRMIYALTNNRLSASERVVEASALSVIERSISTFIRNSARSSVLKTIAFARNAGIDLQVSAVEADFTETITERFDQAYMGALFDYGRQKVQTRRAWVDGLSEDVRRLLA